MSKTENLSPISKSGKNVSQYAPANSSGHGGNIYRTAKETGIAEERLIDFSASINPLGVSEKVKNVVKNELGNLINYPDPDARELREKLANYHNIDPETIICGNGSTELIYLVPRALKPENVLVLAPTFSEYEKAVRLQSTEERTQIEILYLDAEEDFRINPDKFISGIQGCDMAFLCNPNNPTGTLLKKEEVLKIAKALQKAHCYLVVDEAFIDFMPWESVISEVSINPYLIVLRSMTKFHALAGLRIGYGVFHSDLVNRVKNFKEPWTVNSLAQKAAIAALEDTAYFDETIKMINDEKKFLEESFRNIEIDFIPSAANYYSLNAGNAGTASARLIQKGILVRDCSNFTGMGSSYIRVAVKSRDHNRLLIRELERL